MPEVSRQFAGRLVTPLPLLAQAFQDDGLDLIVDLPPDGTRLGRLGFHDPVEHIPHVPDDLVGEL
ncbi:MAG TPA: hypothetical protein P5304_26155, partial [Phycisphaerae bacterium]|nr:hypothetical protein [Phycisphaerae bacterium]